ncbi:MAG: methyltransferase [Dehalococcoidia bacterium]
MTDERPITTLMRMIGGFRVSQAIHVAAVLGIADLIKDGPRSSEELAQATSTDPDGLYRLLRALASVGVFHETAGRTFGLTPLSECLLSDAREPGSGWALLIGQEYFWNTWGNLLTGVKTGKNIFPQLYGTDVWTYRSERPELNEIFNAAMTSQSRSVSGLLLAAYDFSQFSNVVDVGGNRGALLADILAANPTVRGVVFDQPHVASDEDLRTAGVADRCKVVVGSFFESVPEGGDAYILKSIIHDWPDQESAEILRVCRKSMGTGSRLLVIDRVIGDPNMGPATKFLDLNMLALPGGRERTEDEFRQLFDASGFRLTRVVPLGSDEASVVEGVPA